MDDRRDQRGQRFVLLRHEMPPAADRGSHWDLMLENRGILLTWELPKLPEGPLPATFEQLGIRRLPDHRIDYLEYEGSVSNHRGSVQRVDCGDYQLTSGEREKFVHVKAIGRRFQIELLVPKAIFQQVDNPSFQQVDTASLQAGEMLQFITWAHPAGTTRQ